jgi:iron complex outermembrane receptor protein
MSSRRKLKFHPAKRCPPARSVWLFSALCLAASAACYAQEDASEQGYLQDFPVVLSASRLSQPVSETPNAVTVIDRSMIKASGFRNIADLFRMVPGMYVDYFNGHMPIVSYRGTTDEYTRRMQVLVDGRSAYLPPFGVVDWEDMPLHIDDIERIEVVRGPAATSYGSNSILGVINIITREAFAANGASLSATRGNAGNADISDAVAHFGRSGEQLDYRLTFGMRSDNGFDFPANSPSWFDGYNDSSSTHFANLRSNYRLSGTDNLEFQMGFSNGVRALGDPRSRLSQPHSTESSSGYQQLTWLHALNQHDDIRLSYYHISRHSASGSFSGADLPGYWITDNYKVHRHELELQHTLHANSNNRVVLGMATRHESVDAPSMFSAPQSLRQHRLFAHDEWRILPPLVLNAGAMLEDDGMGHTEISPRAALNYHVTREHTLRAGVSVAHRNPALVEERSDRQFWLGGPWREWLSSGGLRPERTLSREVGYLGKFDNGLSVDVRAYNDQVSDIIWIDHNLAPGSIWLTFGLPVAVDFRNEFAAQYTGLEGSVKYSWGGARNSLTFSFAHQNVSCAPVGTPYLASNPGVPLPLAPFISAFVLNRHAVQAQDYAKTVPLNSGSVLYVGQMSDDVSFSAAYYQQGTVTVLSATSPQPLTRRVDMRIAKQFRPSGGDRKIGGGEISLVVQNAFQHNNGEQVGYSGYLFDRRAYLTATLNF